MGDWEEIRRLAADFQRAQLAGSAQKLSERNCVELVTKLIELKLIDVIYTTDGKEYLTYQQLNKEVKDELYVSGGRLGLVEIAATLNVDFSHVEAMAQTLCKGDRTLHLVLGQLVSHRYLEDLCRQINEKLQQAGTIAIPSLTKVYDLPADFLLEQVHARLGSIIEGFKDDHDPKVLLTSSHVARNRAKVRGVLSAITVPTTVSSIVSRFGFHEKLFFSLAEELIRTGRLPGVLTGGRTVAKASYIPHSYARAQNAWVDSFYTSNGYLEYDAVARLGISDPMVFIKKKFPSSEGLMFLASCCVGPSIVEQLEVSIDEALSSGGWCDVLPLLPSTLSNEDGAQLVQAALSARMAPSSAGAMMLGECTILSKGLVHGIIAAQEGEMGDKAAKDVESGAVAQSLVDQGAGDVEEEGLRDKKEERRKKATGGSAGGGAQGRQTKTKSTKKKGGKKKDEEWSDDDDEGGKGGGKGKKGKKDGKSKDLEFKSCSELENSLRSLTQLSDCPEEVYTELAEMLVDQLNRKYREVARERFQTSLATSLQNKRRTHGDLGEKVNTLYTTIRLGEKGISEFDKEDHRVALGRHLLKTYGNEMLSEMFQYVAEENMVKVDNEKELTSEARVKVINELPKDISESALKIHKAVNGNSVTEFLVVLESQVGPFCDVMLKKPDKKKDRQILFGHRQSLLEQLNSCLDHALTLHLAVLAIFQHCHGSLLHASGKFVPFLIEHLAADGQLASEQMDVLTNQQRLVMANMSKGQDEDQERETASQLEVSTPAVKKLVAGLKKTAGE
eukprot:GFUD01008312.1.p1 GENE.GFUD01008312.1~~GFUD01008312.1.p1  ORF type:complete len:788 (+),score=294.35 GFUD01008312.1:119-2482(+)